MSFGDIEKNLSIVMQGPIRIDNIVQIANHCRHWRQMFPYAEIILSISTNEAIDGIEINSRSISNKCRLHHRHTPNIIAENAVSIIDNCCDLLVCAEPGLPLPPIKPTDGPNNSNFMINAAKAGLETASKEYVLRIRSDVIFINKNFISLYIENYNLTRRFRNILSQRVMICNLFTVNPFCVERMPYHYSDWFNFGLLDDVRKIWDVNNMLYADTVYYKVNPHAEGSNFRETNFNTRLGVEQHIYTSFLKNNDFNCSLEYHNDTRGITESLMILENEFIIADAAFIKLLTQERSDYLTFDWVDYICIHHSQWKKLFEVNPQDYKDIFEDKIRISEKIICENNNNEKEEYVDHKDNISNEVEFLSKIENENLEYTRLGKIIISIYKIIIIKRMKLKLDRDPKKYFLDSNSFPTKLVYKLSYKGEL